MRLLPHQLTLITYLMAVNLSSEITESAVVDSILPTYPRDYKGRRARRASGRVFAFLNTKASKQKIKLAEDSDSQISVSDSSETGSSDTDATVDLSTPKAQEVAGNTDAESIQTDAKCPAVGNCCCGGDSDFQNRSTAAESGNSSPYFDSDSDIVSPLGSSRHPSSFGKNFFWVSSPDNTSRSFIISPGATPTTGPVSPSTGRLIGEDFDLPTLIPQSPQNSTRSSYFTSKSHAHKHPRSKYKAPRGKSKLDFIHSSFDCEVDDINCITEPDQPVKVKNKTRTKAAKRKHLLLDCATLSPLSPPSTGPVSTDEEEFFVRVKPSFSFDDFVVDKERRRGPKKPIAPRRKSPVVAFSGGGSVPPVNEAAKLEHESTNTTVTTDITADEVITITSVVTDIIDKIVTNAVVVTVDEVATIEDEAADIDEATTINDKTVIDTTVTIITSTTNSNLTDNKPLSIEPVGIVTGGGHSSSDTISDDDISDDDTTSVTDDTTSDTDNPTNIIDDKTGDKKPINNDKIDDTKPIIDDKIGDTTSITDDKKSITADITTSSIKVESSTKAPQSGTKDESDDETEVPVEIESMRVTLIRMQKILLVAAGTTFLCILFYSIYYINLIRKIYAKDRISD